MSGDPSSLVGSDTAHASCVAVLREETSVPTAAVVPVDGAVAGWRGALLLGASGAGKSALTLRIMALGGRLVADDRVLLAADGRGGLIASAPAPLRGLVEARGLGVMRTPCIDAVSVALAVHVDPTRSAPERAPPVRWFERNGGRAPMFFAAESGATAAALYCLLKFGSVDVG